VERALHAASGLHGKRPVHVDAISPALLGAADREASHRLLAGEKLAHFGGFLDEKLRRHDFALGYRSAQAWLEDAARGPAAHGIPADALRPALATVRDRAPALGDAPSGNLGVKGWLELSRLLAHTVRVVLRDARRG
jgi:hypothetical protein